MSFGCAGANQSPALECKDPPVGTKSFAITFFDTDAPTGSGFWHYVAYDMPASTRNIALGDLSQANLPAGSKRATPLLANLASSAPVRLLAVNTITPTSCMPSK
jgi:phosphatidylethanolamine-binding protein (PEBP) family uncharacterized protein